MPDKIRSPGQILYLQWEQFSGGGRGGNRVVVRPLQNKDGETIQQSFWHSRFLLGLGGPIGKGKQALDV